MAWIELDMSLLQSSEVLFIADALDCEPHMVIGPLAMIWGYVDDHGRLDGEDAIVEKVTVSMLQRAVPQSVAPVVALLVDVEWLIEEQSVIRFPNYKRHAPKGCRRDRKAWGKRIRRGGAKTNDSEPKTTASATSSATTSATVSGTDSLTPTDRPTNIPTGPPPIPPKGGAGGSVVDRDPFDPAEAVTWDPADVEIPEPLREDPAFQAQWADWLFHLQDKHRPPSRAQCKAQLAQLATLDPRRATQVLIEHLTAGWLSLDINREPSKRSSGSGKPARKVPIFRGARQEAASA